ncbi:Retrovirus-related Pol polyprotein from transposon [Dictyocoela muelleri]|nr:Retrovirus-related Pol polyprotein from transposon [Dictyocoela muelleri]
MSFKRSSFISCLAASGDSRRKSNLRGKTSYKLDDENRQEHKHELSRSQDDFYASQQDLRNINRLYKGMDDSEADIQIFMLQQKRGFEELLPKQQFLQMVEQSDKLIQRWYYEKGSAGELPDNLNSFNDELKKFIMGKSIDDLDKFREELWSEYLERLKSNCTDCNNKVLIRKLRSIRTPKIFECIFFFSEYFEEILSRVKEYERLKDKHNTQKKYENFKLSNTLDNRVKYNNNKGHELLKNTLNRYKCGELGHIARNCKSLKRNLFNENTCTKDLDIRIVKLNGVEKNVLFDSGSSINILTDKEAKNLNNVEIRKLENPIFIKLLNGDSIKAENVIKLEIKYKNISITDDFYVIRKGIIDVIIGCELIKRFDKETFPIECSINTRGNTIISWNRPIRNLKDKNDFKKLIDIYEKKGYVERSRSTWLNPVVLNRKKNGDLRFTLDLRRVNELVDQDKFEIPNITEIIRSLHGAKYFSVLDLEDGFFQVPLCEEDRDKTTFLDANYQLKRFTKMPRALRIALQSSNVEFQLSWRVLLKKIVLIT